ncbi:MAG: hypothetical protein RLZZ136_117 [Pseudomonadota bacterium]
MTGLILAIGLAIMCFAVLAWGLKLPRKLWEVTGIALLLGLTGYALQGSPAQTGAPKAPVERMDGAGSAAMIAERQKLNGSAPMGDNLLVTADAFSRHGQYADAAETLRVAVVKDPANGDAWLSLANALVQHAEGNLSPAALFAFSRAEQAAPSHPGPPFFLGLALARSGRLLEGRAVWGDLLARTPPQAPWRADLTAQLADLDAFIARQNAMMQTQ